MVQDVDSSGLPGCDICQHPAGHLVDGVFLCSTHLAEARHLRRHETYVEWELTPEGLAALARSTVPAPALVEQSA